MRRIKRTVSYTAAFGQRINALGEFEDVCEALEGVHDAKFCQAKLRRKYDDDTICINYVESETGTYVLSGEDFLKYATLVED